MSSLSPPPPPLLLSSSSTSSTSMNMRNGVSPASSQQSTTNCFRPGDYVYFETSSSAPYQIRRIEELVKTPNGNVEAKVMCFYRRRDIPGTLTLLADKHQSALEEENERQAEDLTEKQKHQLKHRELFLSRQIETLPATHIRGKCVVTLLNETESLSSYLDKEDTFFYSLVYDPQQKTLLADRGEIRVGSRFQAESLPKVLAEDESDGRDLSQLEELEFSPEQNPLSDAEIDQFLTIVKSVGTFARALDHTSSVKQPSLHMSAAAASRDITLGYAMKVLHQNNYDIGKAVLTLVPPTGPILCRDEMEDWSASEANLFEEAMDKYGKDFSDIRADFLPWKSLQNIVEYYYMWKTTDRYVQQKRVKAVEAENKLKQVYIPIPNPKSNDRMNGGNGLIGPDGSLISGRNCESCAKPASSQWFAWGPAHVQCRLCHTCWFYWKKFGGLKYANKVDAEKVMNNSNNNSSTTSSSSLSSSSTVIPGMSVTNSASITGTNNNHVSRNDLYSSTTGVAAVSASGGTSLPGLKNSDGHYPCPECGKVFNRQERLVAHVAAHRPHRCTVPGCGKEFKFKAHLARHCAQAHGIVIRTSSPRPIMKTRAAFYLHTNEATKVARRTCGHLFRPRHAARRPFVPINAVLIKNECAARYASGPAPELPAIKNVNRGAVVDVSHKLGTPAQECPEWLIAAPKDQLPQPERLAFTPPARGEDGQFILPRPTPTPAAAVPPADSSPNRNIWRIKNNVTSKKRSYEHTNGVNGSSPPGLVSNGRPKVATITRVGGRKQMISWVDAPDDVFFIATEATRRVRKRLLTPAQLRSGARKPWNRVFAKLDNK